MPIATTGERASAVDQLCWRLTSVLSTTDRLRSAACGSGARCHGCDSCTSLAVSRSSDRPGAGSPFGCSTDPRRCGPTRRQGAGSARRWLRRRSRSSPTVRRRDTHGCSDPGGYRSAPCLIRANVLCWCRAAPMPDMRYCSRSSGCASRGRNRSRGTVSCSEATTGYRHLAGVVSWSPLSGLNRWPTYYKYVALATELRGRVETAPIISAQSSWSMTRCEDTGRAVGRRPGLRPGNGIRSAMLLSGLTTALRVLTAS
jgi:hypothetical protein